MQEKTTTLMWLGHPVIAYIFVFRLGIEKTQTMVILNLAVAFCDTGGEKTCIVDDVYILKDTAINLPICHPNGSVTWPKSKQYSIKKYSSTEM